MNTSLKLNSILLCIAACTPNIGAADPYNHHLNSPFNYKDYDYGHNHGRWNSNSDNYHGAYETLYTQTNDASNNEVLAFQRYGNGNMKGTGHFSTGGKGNSTGLGNQGALAFSENKRFLFAVNTGSNDVSVFRADGDKLKLVDRAADQGKTPVSVTSSGNLVYVVNSGDDSIYGYKFNPATGKLNPLAKSYQKLSAAGAGPAQISFDRDSETLVVTEKATNKITTFTVNDDGTPSGRHVIDSAGSTPFGFAFGRHNQFFVSEAQGGAINGATVSSYQLHADGSVELIDDEVAVDQTAACWLVTTPNGRIAYTADTPADTISAFAIDRTGHLSLLNAKAATEIKPTDIAMAVDGSALYTLSGGDHSIGVYKINKAGALQKLKTINALPAGITGLVVR